MSEVTLIPILSDNYAYLIESGGVSAVVDPGDGDGVIAFLEERGVRPDFIFNTHHHGDHIAGNAAISQTYGAKLVGPKAEEARIAGMDQTLSEGDVFTLGDERFRILETPGHTNGHICFYGENSRILFCGDTLFVMGCGRLFEGTPAQMWASFQKILALPEDTKVYCGHEYTLANAEFCAKAEPDNHDIRERLNGVRALREKGEPTIPSTLALEKRTNVFLRAGNAQAFAKLRSLKDNS